MRASLSVLWLGSATDAGAPPVSAVRALLKALLDEFAPLAARRQQSFDCVVEGEPQWPMPGEVIETVFANLLLNAIQHGGPGVIRIEVEARAGSIVNPPGSAGADGGFGLGLQLVECLLQRFVWQMLRQEGESIEVRVQPLDASRSNARAAHLATSTRGIRVAAQ